MAATFAELPACHLGPATAPPANVRQVPPLTNDSPANSAGRAPVVPRKRSLRCLDARKAVQGRSETTTLWRRASDRSGLSAAGQGCHSPRAMARCGHGERFSIGRIMALSTNARPYLALTLLGVLLAVGAASEIYGRASINVVGQVATDETRCQKPQHNRCVTSYVLRAVDGSTTAYSAGPTDHSLRRYLPVETTIEKHRWQLTYRVNGVEVDDFPILFYCGLFWSGVGAFAWGLYLHKKWPA